MNQQTQDSLISEALERCAAEVINRPGMIQPHGFLIAIDEFLMVRHASVNIDKLLGVGCEQILGCGVTRYVGPELISRIQALFYKKEIGETISFALKNGCSVTEADVVGQAFYQDQLVILELELAVPSTSMGRSFEQEFIPLRNSLDAISGESSLEKYVNGIVEQVSMLTQFDRVMIYRFDSQWDGAVIAEHCNGDFESFLGHHFPAADIPPQARELYLKSQFRQIVDISSEPVAILPPLNAKLGLPLDLTYSSLRSFSPVHLEYLKNMGVAATLTVSLVVKGRLWGLIACHHHSAKKLDGDLRALIDFVGKTTSLKIADLERLELHDRLSRVEKLLRPLAQRLVSGDQSNPEYGEILLESVGATGAVVCINQRKFHIGKTPDLALINHLIDWLKKQSASSVYVTDSLPGKFELASKCGGEANGLLAVTANKEFTDYVLWFRPEIIQSIRWAGNPEKTVEFFDGAARISPRKSFRAWVQSYGGHSAKWSLADIDVGQRVAMTLLTQMTECMINYAKCNLIQGQLNYDEKTLLGYIDALGVYLEVSENCFNLLGFKCKEIEQHPITDFVFEDDVQAIKNYLLECIESGAADDSLSFRHCRKDGRYIWMEIRLSAALRGGSECFSFASIDVSERQHYKAGLEDLHRRYNQVLDEQREGILIIDSEQRILHASDRACQLLGYECRHLLDSSYLDLVGGSCAAGVGFDAPQGARRRDTDQTTERCIVTMRNCSGDDVAVELHVISLGAVPNGSAAEIVIFRVCAQSSPAFMGQEAGSTRFGAIVTDRTGRIKSVNSGFTQITGYSAHEAIGRTPGMLRSAVHSKDFYQEFWRGLAAKGHWRGEIWNRKKNGEIYPQLSTVFAISDKRESVNGYVAVFQDVSTSKNLSEQAHERPDHDSLTGLPGRIFFERSVSKELLTQNGATGCAIAFMDLDAFTEVNDVFGHVSGDRLIYRVANRLANKLRVDDRLGRWGGDKFIFYLSGIDNKVDARRVMERHLAALAQEFRVAGKDVRLQARVGISLYPQDARDVDSLMHTADLALGQAKKEGGGAIVYYSPELAVASAKRFALSHDLRLAIPQGQLFLVYQPQVDPESGKIAGLEALVRWQHPERGLISPAEFITMAEEVNLIDDLGSEVFRMACSQIRCWLDEGGFDIPVGINVSPCQLKPGLAHSLKSILDHYRIPPSLIEIEITESALQPTQSIRAIVQEVKDIGVKLAIDDFGTGYSSLSHLKLFPFDRLKIDKSFVDGLPENPDDMAIAQAIVALGKALKVNVLAEGVEHMEQAKFLKLEGVDVIQGYFYSRPLRAEDLEHQLRSAKYSMEMTGK